MRVGFKILKENNIPVYNACIVGNIIPSYIYTDKNGEAFAIAPIFTSLAEYVLDIKVTCVRGVSVKLHDKAKEIENYYIINIKTKTWSKETLNTRIGGDGFYSIDTKILSPDELIISTSDPMLKVSNCELCLYFDRIKRSCIVNGNLTKPIPIKDSIHTTSRKYYPVFLIPSQKRLTLDNSRGLLI